MLDFEQWYQQSLIDPLFFWQAIARDYLHWISPFHTVMSGTLAEGNIRWFEGGELNVSYNCIDRHLPLYAEKTAIIWQGDEENDELHITYAQLQKKVCQLANALKQLGVKKQDRVCIYLPMIPEAVYAMLACARIGAIHSVVFAGFSAEALANRIEDAQAKIIITADAGNRGGKKIPLKANVDKAMDLCSCIEKVIVVLHGNVEINWEKSRDIHYEDLMAIQKDDCAVETMAAEDPLFILYTSGSTGKPKGIVHTSAGYLLYAAFTHKQVFDYQPGDIYWCTADVGWITGHSYSVYGALANAATTVIFEGIPSYPDPSRFWKIIDKFKVNQFYTAPTAIRSVMAAGDEWVQKTSRQSLRILGSVGEPINAEAWQWYHDVVGNGRCFIVDTWWQTETGGHMLTPIPYHGTQKPGSATKPFFGVHAGLIDDKNQLISGEGAGKLVITQPWPGMASTIYQDHQRYLETYFQVCPGYYFTGDGARRDAQGDYWITGRIDDAINVSGHLLGTAEIENALLLHSSIAEVAVVGFPHTLKGQGIYAFVQVKKDILPSDLLQEELTSLVREKIGPIATIDRIQWIKALPKTRSGKVMRRILRKIAAGEVEDFGDITTLADPQVVQDLLSSHANS